MSKGINLSTLIQSIPLRQKIVDQTKREQFEWSQWESATKSINDNEIPPKEKHLRNLVHGTIQSEGARLFWSMVIRIHVESHPIVSWKFIYVIHRLLREGHRYVVEDTMKMANYFDQLKKHWNAVQRHYGLLTYRYCCLIETKLKFHQSHSMFAGNLTVKNLPSATNQLARDLMDYLNEILNLIQSIFTSLDQSRSNSMTSAGQCRLHPLVLCIEDSSLLYDYLVKIFFQLHQAQTVTQNEDLREHRQRFVELYRRLKLFYNQSSKLNYLKNFIQVPRLTENPPDFQQNDDQKNHQTPMAVVQTSTNDDAKEIAILEQQLKQSNALLEQNRSETDDLHRTIAARDAELLAERQARQQSEEQLRQLLTQQKGQQEIRQLENENKNDEKFEKLLQTYNQLNDAHVIVLRQYSELQKQVTELKDQLIQCKDKQQKNSEEFATKTNGFQGEIFQLRQTNDELQARIQSLSNERNDYEMLSKTTNERLNEIEQEKQNIEKQLKELENSRDEDENVIDLVYEKEKLEEKIHDLEQIIREWAQKFVDLADKQKLIEINHDYVLERVKQQYKQSILTTWINQMHDILKNNNNNNNGDQSLQQALICLENIDDLGQKSLHSSETIFSFLHQCSRLTQFLMEFYRSKKTNDVDRDLIFDCIDLYSLISQDLPFHDQMKKFIDRLNTSIKFQ